ncbi:hypothetical protein C2G38_2219404 [Gigaspora rosea]|uniref:Uncharacterized protein n=1 Tax=Gigaspora rosea TaxID=44941 RepID=A0A397UEJ2_9GLOM|nr:hypothetical protein C2G38_2219404 [Gigaspora rosea]
MNIPFLKSYYRQKSIYLTSEQIETIRSLKDKVPKYRIMRDFHINEHRVDDIWEDRERQQQIIQKTLYPETTPLNTEIKKKSSKSRSKSVRMSDPIPTINSNEKEKISSEDLDALYEKEARRDEKNKANMTRLLATT